MHKFRARGLLYIYWFGTRVFCCMYWFSTKVLLYIRISLAHEFVAYIAGLANEPCVCIGLTHEYDVCITGFGIRALCMHWFHTRVLVCCRN